MQCLPRCGVLERENWEDADMGEEDDEDEENFYVELAPDD